jgi:hypothetical protein
MEDCMGESNNKSCNIYDLSTQPKSDRREVFIRDTVKTPKRINIYDISSQTNAGNKKKQ